MSLPPPSVLPKVPRLSELSPGSKLVRIYNPVHGPWHRQRRHGPLPKMRFDHHLPASSDRSVWYAGTSMLGAICETFGDSGFLDKGSGRRICIVRLRLPLQVLNLVGTAARVFGLDQRIGTDRDYARCQEWARAFYDRYPAIQGIRWRGRQAGSICVALNDRVDMHLLGLAEDYDIADPTVWPGIVQAAHRARLQILGA